MAIFNTDLEAVIFLIIITICLYFLNRLISLILNKRKTIPLNYKIITNFVTKIITLIVVIFIIIEGFPVFALIDPTYTAILTGAISTAIAFASSGIFENLIAGIVLLLVRPLDIDDLVKLEGIKGVVRSIGLTKVTLETFDNILIEISNSQVISSKIVNYTVKIGNKKNYTEFKNKILAPQDKGFIKFNNDISINEQDVEMELKQIYDAFSTKKNPKLYIYTFNMAIPYNNFQKIMDKTEEICESYRNDEIFRIKPKFIIINLGVSVIVKVKILTFDVEKIFEYQPKLAEDIYHILYQMNPTTYI